jgi:hypothetical protein
VVVELLRQLRRFGLLKREGRGAEANELFFHSFVGSIICERWPPRRQVSGRRLTQCLVDGHGEVKGVSAAVAALAVLLGDTLFLVRFACRRRAIDRG